MTALINEMKEELAVMKTTLRRLGKEYAQSGHMTITAKHEKNKTYYYLVDKNKSKRIYLGAEDSEKFNNALRAAYRSAAIEIIKDNIELLSLAIQKYRPCNNANILAQLSPCVRTVNNDYNGIVIMPELFQWAHEKYEKNPKPFREQVIIAKDGTRVRSKSECVVYNMLLNAGLPFRYDPLLEFISVNEFGEKETVKKAPDFQIICPDRSFILIEHAGMLLSSNYAIDLAKKIQLYLTNGYILGYSLFVTSDTEDGGFDSSSIERMINVILNRFPML